LRSVHRVFVVNSQTDVQNCLEKLHQKYTSTTSATFLRLLEPTMERLGAFSSAISAFVQADPTISYLVNSTSLQLQYENDDLRYRGGGSW
jgi:hypothetical protein